MKLHPSKLPLFIFLFLLILGSILRLYRLRATMQFLGDQGRDALIARGILMERDPAFIGPVTSVGNMYLGPLYYYFMMFPLMLTYPDPSGPAYAVAVVGIATLALIYLLGREMVGEKVALITMGLYAISPVIITNVRFSWNPNIVPFFALLLVYGLYKTLTGNDRYWLLVGMCATVLFQLHYITLILIGCAGLVWLRSLFVQVRAKHYRKDFFVGSLLSLVLFAASLIPLAIFDTKHDYLNAKAFASFFTGSSEEEGHFRSLSDPSGIFYAVVGNTLRNLTEIFGVKTPEAAVLLFFAIVLYAVLKTFVFVATEKRKHPGRLLIGFIFAVSMLILGLYKESIYDHYLGFVFPVAALLLGVVIERFWSDIFLRPLVLLIVGIFVFSSIRNYPGTANLGLNVDVVKHTADQIVARVEEGETYDILLLSHNNDFLGMNYRYFLTTTHKKPAKEEDVWKFKKLFVIDEEKRKNPLDTPQYKVAIWPNREILDDFTIVHGPRVVMLTR